MSLDPTAEVLLAARRTLHQRARSFRIAARLLPAADADDVALTYALCREADDLVDEAPDVETARSGIGRLREELSGRATPRALVVAFYRMALRRRLPIHAAWDLVDTVAQDAGPVRIADDAALGRYAYGVAGTVGLLMAALLGARGERATACAVDLGLGMQISNIVRDVTEDAHRDRVYLPATRLAAHGLRADAVADGSADPAAVAAVCRDLVALADGYYASARAGLPYLPLRGRLAVAVAASLYQAIGHAVVGRGVDALKRRTVLGRFGLALAVARGVLALVPAYGTRNPAFPVSTSAVKAPASPMTTAATT